MIAFSRIAGSASSCDHSLKLKPLRDRGALYFINRHFERVQFKKAGLASVHSMTLERITRLDAVLKMLRKTHGFFQCRFNLFLKSQITLLKKRITRLQSRCKIVVDKFFELDLIEHKFSVSLT